MLVSIAWGYLVVLVSLRNPERCCRPSDKGHVLLRDQRLFDYPRLGRDDLLSTPALYRRVRDHSKLFENAKRGLCELYS